MKKLDWIIHSKNATSRTSVEISYGHYKAHLYDLNETQRQAFVSLLIALERDLKDAQGNG